MGVQLQAIMSLVCHPMSDGLDDPYTSGHLTVGLGALITLLPIGDSDEASREGTKGAHANN